jgi:hypothetical protein
MYNTAYTTQFESLDGRMWTVVISINDYQGRPREISLDGDEPCVIEWPETDKQDVVQPSTCTLRVSNEQDRQMLPLMSHPDAVVSIGVDGHHYWYGHLDESIYEEPYSFVDGYVTELTFSDFGILNRKPFKLTGRQSVMDIVNHCLGLTSSTPVNHWISLCHAGNWNFVSLKEIYINADRFRADDDGDNWGGYTDRRKVLEEVLRPLGLRLIGKNGQIYIYDIEWMRYYQINWEPIRWKGTDAYIKGSETYGWYEVGFEPDADETLAEDPVKDKLENRQVPVRYHAMYYDEDADEWGVGFYIWMDGVTGTEVVHGCKEFKTRPFLSTGSDSGHAWIVRCQNRPDIHVQIPPLVIDNPCVCWPVTSPQGEPVAEAIFSIESAYIPLVPDRERYQLRVNLDLLVTPLQNPLEEAAEWNLLSNYPSPSGPGLTERQYDIHWKKYALRPYVPVKLELLDVNGDVVMHYVNMHPSGEFHYYPYPIGKGFWDDGPANFGHMMLSYYKDGCEATPLEGWATNRQTMPNSMKHLPSLYAKRDQGEYVPMPPRAGILKLTVSNCVYYYSGIPQVVTYDRIRWHLLKDAKITLVKANTVDDGIPTDTVYNRRSIDQYVTAQRDKTSEKLQANTWSEGIPPSARGLYFDDSGNVYEQFRKNERCLALSEHRLFSHIDQTVEVQPVISGTAELNLNFVVYTDACTPGPFLVTALRQDLHQGTEHVTMVRIAPVGGYCYEYSWSDAVCVQEETIYGFAWSSPICQKK